MTSNLPGPKRAAAFLISLGEQTAARVLAELDEQEIQSLAGHMAELGETNARVLNQVTEDFYNVLVDEDSAPTVRGSDFLKAALGKAMDSRKVDAIMDNVTEPAVFNAGGLETVRQLDPKVTAALLENEHPQTAAIVLAHLEPLAAAQTLSELPEDLRPEILRRLAKLERVAPQVLRELDETLRAQLLAGGSITGSKMGGSDAAAKIMGALDRTAESRILSVMDEVDHDLAKEIRGLRFTFEDIQFIDDAGIQLLIKHIDQEDLLVALKTASDEVKEKIVANLSHRAAMILLEDLDSLGPMRLSEVERAQLNIVTACKALEESGKLVLTRAGGEAFV